MSSLQLTKVTLEIRIWEINSVLRDKNTENESDSSQTLSKNRKNNPET